MKHNPKSTLNVAVAFIGELGCCAAGITTPLDVAKTRIMLAEKGSLLSKGHIIIHILQLIYRERGVKGLFSGVLPRMMWISVGGAIFLGVFDKARKTINNSVYYTQNVAVT